MKKIFLAMLLLTTFIFSGCDTQAAVNKEAAEVNGDLKISMMKVYHGDAILVQTKKQTILIDTGDINFRDQFVNALEKLSVTKIDKLILSHPHADHIGGAKMLIEPSAAQLEEFPYLKKISVAEVYDNGAVYGSASYRNYIKATKNKGLLYKHLKDGDMLDFGDGVTFKVLSPTSEFIEKINSGQFDQEKKSHYINNSSLVCKLTYKNFSMLFTGDCEKESEAEILSRKNISDLKCDVLKSGHHGSYTSSSKEFVEAVKPSCVLISTSNNDEDPYTPTVHPNVGILNNYLKCGVTPQNIFCTRFNGIITLTSDGQNFSVKPEVEDDWVKKWIAVKREDKQRKKMLKSLGEGTMGSIGG